MDENYKLLKDVVGFSYVIGSYQRGYRWDEVNVRELLEDIFEDKLVEDYRFTRNDYMDENEVITELISRVRDTEYCLQPLVLKKNDNGYSVIDGQQRLTTLYIIMKALCSVSDKKFPVKFSIEYKSREKSKEFLQNLSDDSEATNIDAAYILQAYHFSEEWFLERNKAFIELLDENFVECNESRLISAFATYLYKILLEKTKFIWDEIDESSADMNKKEQKIFADRNTGRLELTDSELIKSLFMNPEYYGKGEVNLKDRQTLISEIWDIYENELHNDELWKFLPISAYEIDNLESRKYAIAFVLFVSKIWKRQNTKDDNKVIIEKWMKFRSSLIDLDFSHWRVSGDYEYATIVERMVNDIHTNTNDDVDSYFVLNDFDKNSPFGDLELLSDYKCRLLERKIKSKLIIDGAIAEEVLDEVSIGNRRWGYLYYICGFLDSWLLGDWSNIVKWDGTELNSYIELIKDSDTFEELMRSREAKVVFAYASQYDSTNKCLLSARDINACNNEHIWNHDYLEWDDDEYDGIVDNKLKMLNHLKVMVLMIFGVSIYHIVPKLNFMSLVSLVMRINIVE